MRIYLTGFMASGKSTVGPEVADRLGMSFLDLDTRIEDRTGRSIPTIFARDGEEAFRELETELLHETGETDELVVALGGGALVDEDNRSFAKSHGWVVSLQVSPETVLERVEDEAEKRPLLQDDEGRPLPRDQMRDRIEHMMSARAPAYADAHISVDATQPPPAVAEAVVTAVREREGDVPTTGRG